MGTWVCRKHWIKLWHAVTGQEFFKMWADASGNVRSVSVTKCYNSNQRVPEEPWSRVYADFIGPLPRTCELKKYLRVAGTGFQPHYPTQVTPTERAYRTIKTIVAQYGKKHYNKWDAVLPELMLTTPVYPNKRSNHPHSCNKGESPTYLRHERSRGLTRKKSRWIARNLPDFTDPYASIIIFLYSHEGRKFVRELFYWVLL